MRGRPTKLSCGEATRCSGWHRKTKRSRLLQHHLSGTREHGSPAGRILFDRMRPRQSHGRASERFDLADTLNHRSGDGVARYPKSLASSGHRFGLAELVESFPRQSERSFRPRTPSRPEPCITRSWAYGQTLQLSSVTKYLI